MLGASLMRIVGTPLLMFGIRHIGFVHTAWVAAAVALAVIVPLAVFVLKRRPQDLVCTQTACRPQRALRRAAARRCGRGAMLCARASFKPRCSPLAWR